MVKQREFAAAEGDVVVGENQAAANVLESLQLLRSDDPVDRKRGIMALSPMIEDPRVLRVFEHLYENDPDRSVRQLAWHAIVRQGPSIPAPGPITPPPPNALAPAPAAELATTSQPPTAVVRPRGSGSQGEPFLLNPANLRLLVAQARKRPVRQGGFVLALAVLVLLAAGIAWGWVLPGWLDQYRLDRSGVTTEGEIIRLYVQTGEDNSFRYYVSYRFPVERTSGDALIYRLEQRVMSSAYASLAPGSRIDVTYLPDRPEVIRLSIATPGADLRDRLTLLAGGLSGLALLLFLISIVSRRPARNGQIVWGEIVRCVGETRSDGDFNLRLRYQFRTPNGKLAVKQISRIRNDLVISDLPQPGTPVIVYYQNETSHRLL